MTNKTLFHLVAAFICGTVLCHQPVKAQVSLSGTNYTQNFNGIASGLPSGWSVRTNASGTSLGTAVTFNTAAVSWGTQSGQFANGAGTTNNSLAAAAGTESTAQQSAFTNRCPIIRQTASYGNPGAAFVFQIANSSGLSNLIFSMDFILLKTNPASTTWTVDYAVGNSPATFTTLGTYTDPGVFGATTQTYSLGTDANDQTNNVWIRIVALSAATGAGSCDTFGIDNFSLNYAGPSAPTISSSPASSTNGVLTAAALAVVVSGAPPLGYQWFKGTNALSDGGNISGSTNDTLRLSNLLHTNAGDYTVVITNASGSVTSSVATLTVVGFAIVPLSPTNTLAGMAVDVPLAFIDNQSPVTTVSGSSGNQGVLPDGNILGTAGDNSGTVTLVPLAGTSGVVRASLTASDGSFSTNAFFSLLVVPSANVLFNDHFDYPNDSVTAGSLGIWRNHSGPAGELAVTNKALRVSRSFSEDACATLLGAPFATNGSAVLYSRFTVKFTDLPTRTGNYFAHFKDAGTAGHAARIWASTANTNTAGTFRLGIGNANTSTATTAQFPLDLNLNTNYVVVTRLVVSNGVSTLWINPATESEPGVTAADPVTNLVAVTSYAFRQDGSEGNMLVDDLAVATTFHDALGTAPSILIQLIGTDLVLTWDNVSFYLQASADVTGPYDYVLGATSPFTNDVTSAPVQFFRLTTQAPPPPIGN